DSIKYMNNTSVPITLIESDNQSWADNPSIAVGPSGELHVVYLKSNNAAPWSASIMYMNKTCPDSDGDGYSSDIDCDDSNAAINPGVTEIPNDGIDNDCNPATPVAVVSGSGMNYPVPGFSATMSVNVNDSNLSAGNLKYSYTRQKISLISTSITGISATGGTASVTGAGSMNGIAGYTFTATITDGSPDGMGIEVRKPDGTLYFREPSAGGTRAILRWGFNITGQ
ncbi:MAG: putative metal-binding motif-containing protein, partial [Nitrospirae bacterium]|nr:putative metal-binding motif-containing protein [Nitrospirota bacterium]